VAGSVGAGVLFGLARIAQAGHFLSDVVTSGLLVTATSWLLHRAIMVAEWPRRWTRRLALGTALTALAIILSILYLDRPLALFFHAQSERLRAVFAFITQFGLSAGYLYGAAITFAALRIAARLPRVAALAERLRAYSYVPLFFFAALVV